MSETIDVSANERDLIEAALGRVTAPAPPAAEAEASHIAPAPFYQRVNPAGGSGTTAGRNGYCTPKWLATLIGAVDLDPCSNERSHIDARHKLYGSGGDEDDGLKMAAKIPAAWSVFINPPYDQKTGGVIRWVNAYKHTRFTFLLRFDPSTAWFDELLKWTGYIWFPSKASAESRISFEPPPGVETSSNPFPHALYLREQPNAALIGAGRVLRAVDVAEFLARDAA
jgi:hypothetical protein